MSFWGKKYLWMKNLEWGGGVDGYPGLSPIINTTLFDPTKLDVEQTWHPVHIHYKPTSHYEILCTSTWYRTNYMECPPQAVFELWTISLLIRPWYAKHVA